MIDSIVTPTAIVNIDDWLELRLLLDGQFRKFSHHPSVGMIADAYASEIDTVCGNKCTEADWDMLNNIDNKCIIIEIMSSADQIESRFFAIIETEVYFNKTEAIMSVARKIATKLLEAN